MLGRAKTSLLALATATIALAAVLVSLGVWQLHRLAWKEHLLAEIAARSAAPPQALPAQSTWPHLQGDTYEYRHVEATGRYDNAHESLILRASPDGPGFHVITPFHLAGGGTVLVDRGFVPVARRDPASRAAGQIAGSVTISGLLRAPEDRNAFTPADDATTGTFYTRDPRAIAAFDKIDDAAPFSIDLDPTTVVPGDFPTPTAIAPTLPNNHLSYALTWFGLAIGLIAVSITYAWSLMRPNGRQHAGPGSATLATPRRQP